MMNHYQKLAGLGFRLIGMIIFGLGIMWFIFWALRLFSQNDSAENQSGVAFWSAVFYTLFGVVLFLLSKPFGKFIARDF
ncbi:MAG: hypothetical protein M3384_05005 [Acidobacteriota bacterium]|nr:hypothetical protein [Acidobacteriota bacterium]